MTREKMITARFAGKCVKCGLTIEAGRKAYYRKETGMRHLSCNPPAGTVSAPAFTHTATLDFSDVRSTFERVVDGNPAASKRAGNRDLHSAHSSTWAKGGSWVGASVEDMKRWLSAGFPVENLAGIEPDLITPRSRRKMKFGDDGELQLDMMWSGFDYPFLEWEKRERKPGMRVEIGFVFNAHISADVIAQYARWVAQALSTLENEGYDCEILVSVATNDMHSGGGSTNTLMRVKRENEASDFASWSALFSPGGFRMLGFTALVMGADQLGFTAKSSLGHAMANRDWDCSFDNENRTLRILNHQNPSDYPHERMTNALKAAITSAKK